MIRLGFAISLGVTAIFPGATKTLADGIRAIGSPSCQTSYAASSMVPVYEGRVTGVPPNQEAWIKLSDLPDHPLTYSSMMGSRTHSPYTLENNVDYKIYILGRDGEILSTQILPGVDCNGILPPSKVEI